MSPKISTPVEDFTGTIVGVDFKNGEGETEDPAALAYFGRQGYTFHSTGSTADTGKDQNVKGLTPKQKAQALAVELGLSAEGTQAEIEKRIADHKLPTNGDDKKQEVALDAATDNAEADDQSDGSAE